MGHWRGGGKWNKYILDIDECRWLLLFKNKGYGGPSISYT
jgi:hypothetical protein